MTRAAALAAWTLTSALACSGASTPGATTDGGGKIECDTAAQACGGAMTCDLVCADGESKVACRPVVAAGVVAAGQPCSADEPCGAGASCLATATSGQICIPFCGAAGACPSGFACQTRQVKRPCGASAPSYELALCLPTGGT